MDQKDSHLESLTTQFVETLRILGIDRAFIRGMTERGDDLRSPLTPTREAMFSDRPAAIALRLFFCRVPVETSEAALAVKAEVLRELLDCGVLIEESQTLSCPFHLRPVRDLYLFSDFLGDERDAVMGAGETTAVLYQAARPPRRIGSALDLGCGAGTLALLLANDADRVIGADINQRAVGLATLNATVNGIRNVEFRTGDLYAPVEGDRFDLIVSQPPYYPNQGSELTFLHGGERGDELARAAMAGLPSHLTPSGRAFVFASWPDAPPIHFLHHDILELHTSRRELKCSRQSISVVRASPHKAWTERFEVSAECWGRVTPARIDEVFAALDLLRAPQQTLLAATLRLPHGCVQFREGSQILIRFPEEALLGLTPVDDDTWAVVNSVDRSPDVASAELDARGLAVLQQAIRRGLLSLEL